METAHSFRSIRARTVYLIPLYSIGSPLRAFVLRRRSAQQILPRIVEVSLFKMDHFDIEKGPVPFRAAGTAGGSHFGRHAILSVSIVWSRQRVELSHFSTADSE
jgi:hypothetical protein